jgi:hypothetical protein
MKMSQENLEKLIAKMISVTKPNGVSFVEFDLDPISTDEYYMSIGYVVPYDSPFLKMRSSPRSFDNLRQDWNQSIKQSIKNYFNTDVIISSSAIRSETWYKQYFNEN